MLSLPLSVGSQINEERLKWLKFKLSPLDLQADQILPELTVSRYNINLWITKLALGENLSIV